MRARNWIIVLCGLWEAGDILALFVRGFGRIQVFVWNHIIVGILLIIIGVWASRTENVHTAVTLNRVAALAGLWLIVASFLLRPLELAAGLLNDVIVGAIVLVLGAWSAVRATR